jgi:PAS domain S-box-containing protein
MMQDYQNELALIKEALGKNPLGMSVTEIAKVLGKSKNTIGRYLDILLITGQVDMRAYGMAKVFTLSQRLPLSAMLSYANELIMVVDDDLRIIDINEHFLSLLNLSRKDTVGKNLAYIRTPDIDVHELLETITKGENTSGVLTLHVREGGERIFRRKQIPAVFDDGSRGTTVILEDITDHVLAEREIRQSEERFRLMAESIRDGIIIVEGETVVFANDRVAEITGYTHQELTGMDPLTIIAPEDRKKIEEVFMGQDPHVPTPGEVLVWIIRRDGERRFVYTRKTVLQAERSFQFIIMTDITDFKSKETELALSEQRFRLMAENIQDGLIIAEQGTIVFVNRRVSEITGYSCKELRTMGLFRSRTEKRQKTVLPPGTPRLVPEEVERKIDDIIDSVKPDSNIPAEFRVWIDRKDGTKRFVHGKVTEVTPYVVVTDITEFAVKEKTLQERINSLQKSPS